MAAKPSRTFDFKQALALLREALGPLPKGSMFEHIRAGHTSLFEFLVALVVSVRTNDRIAVDAVRRLFAVATSPNALARLPEDEIERLIAPATFAAQKAVTLREVSRRIVHDYGGKLPSHPYQLRSLPGIGPAVAEMAVKLTRGEMFDGTDEHVPRVTHRWGYLRTTKAENAMAELEERLKPEQFAELNALLVPFGKYTCTESEPHCSKCPLAGICKRVGVTESR